MRSLSILLALLFASPVLAQTGAGTVQTVYVAAAKTDVNLKAAYAALDEAWKTAATKPAVEKGNFQKAQVLLRAADIARLNGDLTSAKALATQATTALAAKTAFTTTALAADAKVGKFVTASELALPQSKLDATLGKTGQWSLVGLEPLSP